MGKKRINVLGTSLLVGGLLFGRGWGNLTDFFSIPQSSAQAISNTNSNLATSFEPGSSGGFLPQSFFDNVEPPQYIAAKNVAAANILDKCNAFSTTIANMGNQMINSVQNQSLDGQKLANAFTDPTGATAGGVCAESMQFSLELPCNGSDAVPDIGSLTCDVVQFNPELVKKEENQLKKAMCTIQCEKNKLQLVQDGLSCLKNMASGLNSMMSSLTNDYTMHKQAIDQRMRMIESLEEDRVAQIKDVEDKLGQNQSSGKPGLLGLRDQTTNLVEQLRTQNQGLSVQFQQIQQSQKALDEQIQLATMANTMDCFNTRTDFNYQCTPNGPVVPAKDYLLCRFQQNQNLGANGVIEMNSTTQKEAASKSQALSSLMDQIVADTSNVKGIATSQQELAASMNSSLQILSVADVDRLYGSKLAQFKVGNVSAEDFIMGVLKNCNQRATRQIFLQSVRANTEIGQAQFKIRVDNQNLRTAIQQLFNASSQQYELDMAGLTGQHVPLDLSACRNAPAQVQLNCLNNIQKTLLEVMQGTTPSSTMLVQIKGNNPSNFINFTCNGLNGCINSLQNLDRNLNNEKVKLDKYTQDFVMVANQSTTSYFLDRAKQLNGMSQLMEMRYQAINAAILSLGQGSGLNVPFMKGEDLQPGGKYGLFNSPQSISSALAKFIAPPLRDFNGEGVSADGVATVVQKLGDNYTKVTQEMIEIQGKVKGCLANRNREKIETVVQAMGEAQAGSCYLSSLCIPQETADQNMESFNNALSNFLNQPGIPLASITTLQTGIQNICNDPTGRRLGEKDIQKILADRQGSGIGLPTQACASFRGTLLGVAKTLGNPDGSMGTPDAAAVAH